MCVLICYANMVDIPEESEFMVRDDRRWGGVKSATEQSLSLMMYTQTTLSVLNLS